MYKITDTLEFTHTVAVMVPADGGHVEQTRKVRFSIEPVRESDSLEPPTDDALQDILRRIIVSIEDVVDDDDNPIPYNDAIRDRLLALPFVRVAIWRSYMGAVTKAKVGN